MAGAGRSWLTALLARHRRLWAHRPADMPGETGWTETSRMGLDDRILATRTQIAAMHRSLAMQKHALDATRRAGQRTTAGPWSRPFSSTPAPGPSRVDVPLEEGKPSDYADTEPMSAFLDSRPFAEEPALK